MIFCRPLDFHFKTLYNIVETEAIMSGRIMAITEHIQGQAAQMMKALVSDDLIDAKGKIFKRLNETIPLNDYRLPTHLYRADLIPLDIFQYAPFERSEMLNAAAMDLAFTHGYPALDDINPIWDRLPCEPQEAFDAFMIYLELPETTNAENPVRFLPLISTMTQIPLEALASHCHVFYWHWRSHAYDLFQVACRRKQRERRIMTVEGYHFAMAENALNKVTKLLDRRLDLELIDAAKAESADEIETKLKDLVDVATKLAQIQRVSVGLPSGGPSKLDIEVSGRRHEQVGDVFKGIAKDAGHDKPTERRSSDMDALLQDPTNLAQIQDMMVRLSRPQITGPVEQGRSVHSLDGTVVDIHGQSDSDEPTEADEATEASLGFELAPGVRIIPQKVEEEHIHNHYLGPETEDDLDD